MNSSFNDQWILDRINGPLRQGMSQKNVWPPRTRRAHKARWMMPLSTDAIRLLDKHPKWVDRDM